MATKKKVDSDREHNDEVEKVFQGVEWTIENLSCWDEDIHGKSITSLTTSIFPKLTIELFPKGSKGGKNYSEVKIHGEVHSRLSGEFSFFDSEGSLLCKSVFDTGDKKRSKETGIFRGPEFSKVVGRVFSNANKGRLTVRVRNVLPVENTEDSSSSLNVLDGCNIMEYMITTIDEYDIPLEISRGFLMRIIGDEEKKIASLGYYVRDGTVPKPNKLILSAVKKDKKVSFSVHPLEFRECDVLVYIRISVIDDDGQKSEDKRHIFKNEDHWNFFELQGAFALNLRFKIIPRNRCKQLLRNSQLH